MVKAVMGYGATYSEALSLQFEKYFGYINPSNMYSATIEGALAKGIDAYQSGVKFNNSSILNCGFATLVDSVMAVKEFVYDKGIVSLGELAKALKNNWTGYEKLHTKICKILLKDAEFYSQSNGGITLSGGECLLQPEACREILNTMKKNNIRTAVDTCGYVPRENIDAVMPYTDIFLYGIKAADADVHIKCTGHSNEIILDNLKYIDKCGCKTEIRIPYVPGYNDNQIPKITEMLKGLKNITGVRALPYHNYAQSKYLALNMENTLPENLPTVADIEHAKNILRDNFLL